jgi:hypothetical protein
LAFVGYAHRRREAVVGEQGMDIESMGLLRRPPPGQHGGLEDT